MEDRFTIAPLNIS